MDQSLQGSIWPRTKRLTWFLLVAWVLVNLGVPWFARDLNRLTLAGFPLGYWVAAQGALLSYLLIVWLYSVGMDRIEAGDPDAPADPVSQAAASTDNR